MMKILSLTMGSIGTNAYLLYNDDTKAAAVIDPSDDAALVAERIQALGLQIQAVLLTHGHFDHAQDAGRIRDLSGAKVYLHPADRALTVFGSTGLGGTEALADQMLLPLMGAEIRVLHTPGHTPGSVCFLVGNELFSGDTLFAGSCGRTDLPGGNGQEMLRSLRCLAALPGDYVVYPGHGARTSLEWERQHNIYIQQAMSLL